MKGQTNPAHGIIITSSVTSPGTMALSAGTLLGLYEIVVALGAGGMGEVYRARDTRLADVSLTSLDFASSTIRSPDGAGVAFVAQPVTGGGAQLYVRRLNQPQASPLAGGRLAVRHIRAFLKAHRPAQKPEGGFPAPPDVARILRGKPMDLRTPARALDWTRC